MESGLLLLTPDDGLLAHFKEVDEGRVSPHQLSGLEGEKNESDPQTRSMRLGVTSLASPFITKEQF